jgi:hypothetical protein
MTVRLEVAVTEVIYKKDDDVRPGAGLLCMNDVSYPSQENNNENIQNRYGGVKTL